MQDQLIETGFRRIGLILALPFAAVAVAKILAALWTWVTADNLALAESRMIAQLACAGSSAVFGALVYGVTSVVRRAVILLAL